MLSLALLPLLVLTATSVFTSALSAATGMGGGILLFSVMTLYFPVNVLIPIHGVIQFINNLFILVFLKKHLKRSLIQPFAWGSLLGVVAGACLFDKIIKTHAPQVIIVFLIAYSLFRPKRLPSLDVRPENFFWVGIATGLLGIIAGAIDPVLAPFFVRDDLAKEEVIANKAFMQAVVHFAKIPVFYILGFDYFPYLALCLITNLACVFGTKLGIFMLKKMDEIIFFRIFKTTLAATGLRLLYRVFA